MRWGPLLLVLVSPLARADFAPGEVPAAMNAYTEPRHALRLSLLGTSAFGFTERTELATYLVADALLFPNLRLEHRFGDGGGPLVVSAMAGAGAGAWPVAAGGVLPLPGGIVVGGGAGLAFGSIQTATLIATVRPARMLAVSVNGGGFAAEGGIAAVAGGATPAGGDGGGGVATETRRGATAGVELAGTLGPHDAIVIAADAWHMRPLVADGPSGMIYARATWTHAWRHLELTAGVYTLPDLPHARALRDAKLPVSPFLNAAWAWR